MSEKSRTDWEEEFASRGYEFKCTDSVLARKDALQAAWERQKKDKGETLQSLQAEVAELAQAGDIPRAFNVKTFRRALDFNRLEPTQFENAWGIATALNVKVEEIFVLERSDSPMDGPSFSRHEVLNDLGTWLTILMWVALGLAACFFVLVFLGGYEISRGLLPLVGIAAVTGLAAYLKLKSNFPAPRILQIALGALFGNLSAIASAVTIVLVDRSLLCDIANYNSMGVVVLYVVTCVFAYPAGQALVSDARDLSDRIFIAIAVALWPVTSVAGFLLPEVTCRIVG